MKCKHWISAFAVLAIPGAAIAGEINVLTWEGYADDSFIKSFEETSECKVNATYVGSNDDFAPKLAAGGIFFGTVPKQFAKIAQHHRICR